MGNIHYTGKKKSSRSNNNASSVRNPVLQSTPQQQEAAAKRVGGEISANVIDVVFIPQITDIVERQAEIYAQEVLQRQQEKLQQEMQQEEEEEEEQQQEGEVSEEQQYVEKGKKQVEEEEQVEDEEEEEEESQGSHDPAAATHKNIFESSSTSPLPSLDELNLPSFLYATSESREEITTILHDVSNHFTSFEKKSTAPWKIHANAAKFERQLDEKYGILRPFITQHPEIEIFLRGVQRKYARGEFSPFRQGKAPVDKKTSIIILFIMYRNGVKLEKLILAATFFLVGLQPWALVILVIFGRQLMEGRRKKKVAGWLGRGEVKTVKAYYAHAENEKAKHDILKTPVGCPITEEDFVEEKVEEYDTMVVGSGVDTLYSAALLARTGRKVLVLSPDNDASGCYSLAETSGMSDAVQNVYGNVPFDIQSNHVAHVERQQRLLAPALCTDTDAQGGVRFCRIGTEADGFTSDILSIPGMGVDSRKDTHPFLLRAGGVSNIAVDAATYLGDGWPEDDGVGHSTSAGYLAAAAGINATASEFYMSKLLPESISGMKKNSSYQEASVRYASAFLDQVLPLNPHVRSLMAGIGMKGEKLPPSKTSMAVHVTNTCAQISPEGFSYPVGGPRAISHALASVIEQNGGKVITGVNIKEFLYNEKEKLQNEKDETKPAKKDGGVDYSKPRCHGVKLVDGRVISVGQNKESCVVSMLGFIPTFIFYMPDDIRTKYGVPSGLQALTERRPLLHFIVGLHGTAEELSLTAADWYRLPNASLALDEMDPITGQVKQGLIGAQVIDFDDHDDSATVGAEVQEENDTEASTKRDKRAKSGTVPARKKPKRNKFCAGQSWMKISFPSAKDPSWKERHGKISTCVVTIEADDNFVQQFDSSPKIFSVTKFNHEACAHVVENIKKDLIDNFPQLQGKIDFISMTGPARKGLSHTPLRYAVKGIRPETPYPGLIVGGSDLTVGDSFSGAIVAGWMAANAVIEYSFIDHIYLEKNITNDLKQFLSSPHSEVNGDDIAVPFKITKSDEDIPQAAESSKEE